MLIFLARRFLTMLVTLAAISVLIFVIINLPEGNYLSNQIAEMKATGEDAGVAKAEQLIKEYSLDKPIWQQYLIWMGFAPGFYGFDGLLQGNLGDSCRLRFGLGRTRILILVPAFVLSILITLQWTCSMIVVMAILPTDLLRLGTSWRLTLRMTSQI